MLHEAPVFGCWILSSSSTAPELDTLFFLFAPLILTLKRAFTAEGILNDMFDRNWGLAVTELIELTLRVQVPNNHILTQTLYYNYYYPKPKYLTIGYLDPLG